MAGNYGMSVDEYLLICMETERSLVELYQFLGSLSKRDPMLLRVWSQAAVEKQAHAEQVMILARMMKMNSDPGPKVDDACLLELAYQARSLVQEVRKGKRLSDRVLNAVLRLEERLTAFYAAQAFDFNTADLRELFKEMTRDGYEHTRQLSSAMIRRIDRTVTQQWDGELTLAMNAW